MSFLILILFVVFFNGNLSQPYQPNWQSLDTRPLPLWYDESKFGIIIHWGVYSVPMYTSRISTDWFWWYWKGNESIWEGSNETAQIYDDFMYTHFDPGTTYVDFAHEFTAVDFNATQLAQIVKASGAKYFLITTKHHEGYTLWPSNVSWNWNSVDVGPGRNLVADIREAILAEGGIHFGVYYSLFAFFHSLWIKDHETNGTEYVDQISYPQLVDLVNTFLPDVIWSDGAWDRDYDYFKSEQFLAWLYNESPVNTTVVTNDRWGNTTACKHGGFYTCADNYEPGKLLKHKWENIDSLDQWSWGYRRNLNITGVLELKDFIAELASTISTGGNLVMNFPPDKNGRILPIFEERLRGIGQFIGAHEEAIYKTKPWIFQNDSDSTIWYTSQLRNTSGFDPYRYYNPQQENNTIVYAFCLEWPEDNIIILPLVIPTNRTVVTLLGTNITLPVSLTFDGGLETSIAGISVTKYPSLDVFVLKIEYAADQNINPLEEEERKAAKIE